MIHSPTDEEIYIDNNGRTVMLIPDDDEEERLKKARRRREESRRLKKSTQYSREHYPGNNVGAQAFNSRAGVHVTEIPDDGHTHYARQALEEKRRKHEEEYRQYVSGLEKEEEDAIANMYDNKRALPSDPTKAPKPTEAPKPKKDSIFSKLMPGKRSKPKISFPVRREDGRPHPEKRKLRI